MPYRDILEQRDVIVGPNAGLELLPRDFAFDMGTIRMAGASLPAFVSELERPQHEIENLVQLQWKVSGQYEPPTPV